MSFMESFRANAGLYCIAGLFFANIFVWYAVSAESRNGVLTVAFLDVGQGDAVFIETPSGNQMLIDGGGGRAVLRGLSSFLSFFDRRIDLVLATHPDRDHIGGLPEVLRRYRVGGLIQNGASGKSAAYEALRRYGEEANVAIIAGMRGSRIALDKDVFVDILFPDRDVEGWDTNTASIVALLTYKNTSFLFTGDAPREVEEYLVGIDGARLDADVLKLGHHGSKTSSSEKFIDIVSPKYAVVSAGRDNRYGHPHAEVLDILEERGVEVYRTMDSGTITFVSDGVSVWRE